MDSAVIDFHPKFLFTGHEFLAVLRVHLCTSLVGTQFWDTWHIKHQDNVELTQFADLYSSDKP